MGTATDTNVALSLFGGLRPPQLQSAARESDAAFSMGGDLFSPDSPVAQRLHQSRATVHAHFAAINIDNDTLWNRMTRKKDYLREWQNQFLETHIESLLEQQCRHARKEARLLLCVNSNFGPIANTYPRTARLVSPYATMKAEQQRLCNERREELKQQNIELSVVHPGAIDTGFGGRFSPEDVQALNNRCGMWMKPGNGPTEWRHAWLPHFADGWTPRWYPGWLPHFTDGYIQREVLKQQAVGDALARMTRYFFEHETIPDHTRNWLMLNPQAMEVEGSSRK